MLVRRYVEPKKTNVKTIKEVGREELLLNRRNISEIIPEEYSNILKEKILGPLKNNLNLYFQKLYNINHKEDIQKGINIIKINRERIQKAIDLLKNMEAQEILANTGISGMESIINTNLIGLQLNLSTGKNGEIFDNIIRKYIFNYSGYQWPPMIDKYNYFIRDDPRQELCCYYWPLYAYIKTIIRTGFNNMDLTDLFFIEKMKRYCDEPFKTKQQQDQQPQQQRKPQWGGDNPQNNKPKVNEPKVNEPKVNKPKVNKPKVNKQNKKPQNQVQMTSFAGACVPLKLRRVKATLQNTIVEWKVSNKIFPISEWGALNQIIDNYIKSLPDENFIINGKTIENFVIEEIPIDKRGLIKTVPENKQNLNQNEKDQIKYGLLKGFIPDNTNVLIDPILKIPYKYNELIKWFGVPQTKSQQKKKQVPQLFTPGKLSQLLGVKQIGGKKGKQQQKQQQQQQQKIDNPVSVIRYSIQELKRRYTLQSPMFILDSKVLENVRRRLLKLFLVIFLQMEEIYINIEQKISRTKEKKNNKDNINEESDYSIKNKIRDLYAKLNYVIDIEKDKDKLEKLKKLQKVAKKKFADFL
jgi:hypothetical protein